MAKKIKSNLTSSSSLTRLFSLLYVKTYDVSFSSFMFHFGFTGSLITSIMLELSSLLRGVGWSLTWVHGLFGALILISWPHIIYRYIRKSSIRLLQGPVFIIDAIFISIMAASGFIVTLTTFGIIEPVLSIWPPVHVTTAYTWVTVSLLTGGRVRHALAMIVFSIFGGKMNSISLFSDACGRCGVCIEACMSMTSKNVKDTPAYKMHTALMNSKKSQWNNMNEVLKDCKECMICFSLCPIGWNKLRVVKNKK